jgi:pimeloyl-ACP methyl ester carboxylesterase
MRIFKVVFVTLIYLLAALVGALYLFPEKASQLAIGAERDRANLVRVERAVEGRNWVSIEGGQGEPLLLIHGFGADKDNFSRVSRFLTPHYRVVVPDLPGFGESDKPADVGYTILEQVERLRAFAKAAGMNRPHIGGSSMGGYIAATWAATYPQEVASLWLLAPAGVASAPESDLAALVRLGQPNPLLVRSEEDFRTTFHFVMSDPPYIPGPILDVAARRRIANFGLEERIFDAIRNRSKPLEELVKGLQTPARIVWGDRDRALHVGGAEILKELMPNASVLLLPHIGHLPMLERPQQVAEDYLAFRASLK